MSNLDSQKEMDRRKFIKIGGIGTLALTLGAAGLPKDLFTGTAYAE